MITGVLLPDTGSPTGLGSPLPETDILPTTFTTAKLDALSVIVLQLETGIVQQPGKLASAQLVKLPVQASSTLN